MEIEERMCRWDDDDDDGESDCRWSYSKKFILFRLNALAQVDSE